MTTASPIQTYLTKLHNQFRGLDAGALADYIPELARASPEWFGIAIVTVDGQIYHAGDYQQLFTIQSASKPIAYGLALQDHGIDEVRKFVGVEPSGEAFNSISLDQETGRPKNPMINAGAIATTSLIKGENSEQQFDHLLDTFSKYIGRTPDIDENVFLSERKTGHRNRALNNLMRSFNIVPDDNDAALDNYFKQCSIAVNCLDLANIAACLANGGVNPLTSVQALQGNYVAQVLSVMSSCGMYDYSGGWIYEVGMPAKSGVGGGIMATLPGQFGLAVFSPLLDDIGNSVRGLQVCRQISRDFELHMFNTHRSTTSSVIRHRYDATIVESSCSRCPQEKTILSKNKHKIKIYSLQGELMFGATDTITQHITHEIEDTCCTIIDLNHVINIDRASIQLFRELIQTLLARDKVILFTYTANKYAFVKQIKQILPKSYDVPVCEFTDNDHALEWCENYILTREKTCLDKAISASLEQQDLCSGLTATQLKQLESLCKTVTLTAGDRLFSIDEPAHSLFFAVEGQLNVQLDNGKGHIHRLATVCPGMAIGEFTLVNGQSRSADVVAKTSATLLELAFSDIPRDIETILLKNIAQQLSLKIVQQNKKIRYFME